MPTTTTGSRQKRGPVARSGSNGHREIKLTQGPVKGLVLKGGKELPVTWTFDQVKLQGMVEENENVRIVGQVCVMVKSVVGEEGLDAMREKIATLKSDPGFDFWTSIVNDIGEAYPEVSQGESSASA